MAAVVDLIALYSDINREIIEQNLDPKSLSRPFVEATESLHKIKDML